MPNVAIFWLDGKRLILAGTPLANSETYGQSKNFPMSHIKYWGELQRDGSVSRDMEYEERPRGRVMYDTKTELFTLTADNCIVRNKRLVNRIMSKLCLPKNTKVLRDLHYKCAMCTGKVPTRRQEEKDWDF